MTYLVMKIYLNIYMNYLRRQLLLNLLLTKLFLLIYFLDADLARLGVRKHEPPLIGNRRAAFKQLTTCFTEGMQVLLYRSNCWIFGIINFIFVYIINN